MNLLLLSIIALVASCCTQPPLDPSPAWKDNNRYAIEMKNDCSPIKHTLGLGGCAFKGTPSGKLTFPPLWDGIITLTSINCPSAKVTTYADKETVFELPSTFINCSYTMVQSFMLPNGDKVPQLDNVMLGRFFIKKFDPNPYITSLKFSTMGKEFDGVGWGQMQEKDKTPVFMVYPKGSKGTFLMLCGEKEIVRQTYTTSPFKVNFETLASCDYELSAVNADHPDMEQASFMYEVQGYTEDLATPQVVVDGSKISIKFLDRNKEGKYVVYGVQINDTICVEKNECESEFSSSEVYVKGITMSGRVYVGFYNTTTKKWRMI